MKSENTLNLLSKDAEKLWFEKIKTTLQKVTNANLELPEKLKSEILEISHSLWIIIDKNIHSKKLRLDVKLKIGYEEIKCDDVSIILKKSNEFLTELLWNDDKEEIEAEIVLSKEIIAEKKAEITNSKWKAEYVISIREKNELENKLSKIVLLEDIIKEINDFREKLNSLLNTKKELVKEENETITEEVILVDDKTEELDNSNLETENTEEGKVDLSEKQDENTEAVILEKETNNIENKIFDYEELRIIKLNLGNKKIELPKQNSLFDLVKEYFSDEKRITFYHLGLYKLNVWFSENKSLDYYNAINIISLLDVNNLCNLFIEWKFWNSDKVQLSVLWIIFENPIRLETKYYGLWKALHYDLIKTLWRWSVQDISFRYKKFLRIIEKNESDINKFDLNSITFWEININPNVKKRLREEYEEETKYIKKSRKTLSTRPKAIDTINDLISKKKKLTKSSNIGKYTKIFSSIDVNKFREFYEIDKDYFIKVWRIEILDLYISALNRLKWDFDINEFEKIEESLNQYILLIKNWVKKDPTIQKKWWIIENKEELLYETNIKFHLQSFNKERIISNILNTYLEKNITNNNFIKVLIKSLLEYDINFISEFLNECWKLFDVIDIIKILEIDNNIYLEIKS